MEMDSYEGLPLNPDTNQANIVLRKKTYGGVPPGAGIREDVIVLFEELEEARNNLAQIQSLIEEYPENTPMDGQLIPTYIKLNTFMDGQLIPTYIKLNTPMAVS